ncbi:MAG: metal ABC transporter ATP-binding protein [Candidatus Dadabacteria bacterium]|nr:metal ABC transporter ATP-binding protein [Candidatus Dadabacteria bacterium]MCY4262676.1 metal ABC transporter ATP-binding protein [Candidatus Dadabacteria bacterium]
MNGAEQNMTASAIRVTDLTVAYGEKTVLWDIDIDIPKGTMVGIIGPNGAGKTTLIKSIQGLVPRVAGVISIYGKPYEKQRKEVSYVPQRGSVDWDFPTSVVDTVKMGSYGDLGWIRRPGRKEHERALGALEKVGMLEFAQRQISQLSGGQQQRVFLARALVQSASVYLLDEPFQGVDATTEKAIVRILKELVAGGKTVLAVHHDLNTVSEYYERVVIMNVGLVDSGKVNEVFNSENLIKAYGGKASFFPERKSVARAV